MHMIERVARALCTKAGEDPDLETPYHPKVTHLWQHYRQSARAAIEAMREPSEAMLIAGMEGALKTNAQYLEDIRHNSHSWSAVHVALGNSKTASAIFDGMIDAALQEGKETGA